MHTCTCMPMCMCTGKGLEGHHTVHSASPSVKERYQSRSPRREGLRRADKKGLEDLDQWPQSVALRLLQVPTGSNGGSGAIFNISVCLAETTLLPKIRPHRLLTETSFLCCWLELYQLSVITLLISR